MISDISLMRLNSLALGAAHLHNKDQKSAAIYSSVGSSLASLIPGTAQPHLNVLTSSPVP